ncbi:MAG: 50S ribosomal protein L22 [Candidatus Latescibacteria bacterium 4484_181]|nr:MAG: 50S ribosomal protein L22 [Candidatus Latescibacteria bacterium 4484_181]RKY67427.1 MAG: 50S ribosomal protein L22 [Candidatus Latescibacterota bacterium]RKY72961.1 MAG: 50S ribosomal protein L22 [Candidatus Latescibacterota bacterium]
MQAKAEGRYIRISPRKTKQVIDMIRGKAVEEALNLLHFCPKAPSVPVEKVIRSAVANLLDQEGGAKVNTEDLIIKDVRVNQGPTLKRFRPRAMGRAAPIRKRSSHITVVVGEEE